MPIATTTPGADDLARCEQLVGALPDTLSGQDQRPVTPAGALGAAWGDPAIVLTCGGSWPVPRTARCQEVDGVDWYVPEAAFDDQSIDVVLTTVGYSPAVRVEVPAQYRPPAATMVGLAPAITEALDRTDPCV